MKLKGASFQAKLLLAFMAVVLAVTTVTVYFAERNLRENQQRALDSEFQDQTHTLVAVDEARSTAIMQRCEALSQSVRLRAALEERDVDDLYLNALSELQEILDADETPSTQDTHSVRASFFRFFDAHGEILSPGNQPAGMIHQPVLDQLLVPMGRALKTLKDQSVGYIPLVRGDRPRDLREVIVTKIRDHEDRVLGGLALGFPIQEIARPASELEGAIKSGICLNGHLYIDDIGVADRHLVADRISQEIANQPAGNFHIELASGPQLLFYKRLDPKTQFFPAYQICLYPLAASLREQQALKQKIVTIGLIVFVGSFGVSLFLSRVLSKPVDQIVAGSVKNLKLRREAESDLRKTNQELEKALADLKATQQQVIQQERMSAIGQMASGIAHDFNNTLMPILGFADLLLKNDAMLSDKEQARACLETVRTAAQDATNVVYRLREFYRPIDSGEEFPIVDLNRIVEQAVSLTEPKWRHQAQASHVTINVSTEFAAYPIVAGEESALREVLTNLIFNAVDAMPDGGRIVLKTAVENEQAVLKVCDTGSGMTEAVRQRCLEPFFSTKGELGTGLGLSMVYGIVERHRGKLEIQSAVGKGTAFIIRLPLAAEIPAEQLAAAPAAKSNSSLNVLIVDDEQRIRDVVSTYLRADGHQVATAISGREALEKFRRHPFDLVMVDRVMPEMSGEQTAKFIKQLNQNVPVIMLTGFGALIEVTGPQPQGVDVVLNKPITIDALRRTIGKLLHAA